MAINIRDFGAGLGPGSDLGAIQAAFDSADDGDEIFFPDNGFNSNLYKIHGAISITKNVRIVGESPRVGIIREGRGVALDVSLTDTVQNLLSVHNFRIVSGTFGIQASVTGPMSKLCKLENVFCEHQVSTSVDVAAPNISLKVENCRVGNSLFGITLSSSAHYDQVTLRDVSFDACSNVALKGHRTDVLGSGTFMVQACEFLNNGIALELNNVTASCLGNSYFGNASLVELTGSGRRLSGTLIGV